MIEVLLALGLISTTVLTVLGIGYYLLTSTRKSIDTTTAQLVGESELQKAIYAATGDSAAPLWAANSASTPFVGTPYVTRVGITDYNVTIFVQDVTDTATAPVGGNSTSYTVNKLKKVDVQVTWWDTGGNGREGYGLLKTHNSRIVNGP